jgi:hypothetical protein
MVIDKNGSTAGAYLLLTNNSNDDNGIRSGGFEISPTGNLGIWDTTNNKWVVKSSKTGEVNLDGTATYATNSGSASKATSATSATYSSTANYAKSVTWANVSSKPTYYAASLATSATYADTATYATNSGSASKATNADTAIYATNSGSASKATSATYSSTATYSNSVKSITGASGGTVSSNISIIKDGATESVYYKVSNGTRSGALLTNGNSLGLYDLANSKWLLKSDVNGNTTFSGTSDYAKKLSSDAIVVEYFSFAHSMTIPTNATCYTTGFVINIPTKTGYKLLDMQYLGFGTNDLSSTESSIELYNKSDKSPNNLTIYNNFNNNATTAFVYFWVKDTTKYSNNNATTFYWYFKNLWIKE